MRHRHHITCYCTICSWRLFIETAIASLLVGGITTYVLLVNLWWL